VRVRLCHDWRGPKLRIETRTWERLRAPDGRWQYRALGDGPALEALPAEEWWRIDREVPLTVVATIP
jgi:hypothetical protein